MADRNAETVEDKRITFRIGINQIAEMRLEAVVSPLLVLAHQARVACHIGGENGGQPAFDASCGQGEFPDRAGRSGHRPSERILTVNAKADIPFRSARLSRRCAASSRSDDLDYSP